MHVLGITGSSGSGVVPSAGTHHPVRAVNLKSYKALEHQHTPEIEQTLVDAGAKLQEFQLRFVPVSAPLSRGILVTCFVELPASASGRRADGPATARRSRPSPSCGSWRTARPRWRRCRDRTTPRLVSRWDRAEAGRRTLAVQAATDNLIKGGAGQAIQNMNLMLGLPETLSLEDVGPWP